MSPTCYILRKGSGPILTPFWTIVNSSLSWSDSQRNGRTILLPACFCLDTSTLHHGFEAWVALFASQNDSTLIDQNQTLSEFQRPWRSV